MCQTFSWSFMQISNGYKQFEFLNLLTNGEQVLLCLERLCLERVRFTYSLDSLYSCLVFLISGPTYRVPSSGCSQICLFNSTCFWLGCYLLHETNDCRLDIDLDFSEVSCFKKYWKILQMILKVFVGFLNFYDNLI